MSVIPEKRRSSFSALLEEVCRNESELQQEFAQIHMQASNSNNILPTASIQVTDFDEETLGASVVPKLWFDETDLWDTSDLAQQQNPQQDMRPRFGLGDFRTSCPSPLSFNSCYSSMNNSEMNPETSSCCSLPMTPCRSQRNSMISLPSSMPLPPPFPSSYYESQFVFPPLGDYTRTPSNDSLLSVSSESSNCIDMSDNASESSFGVGEFEDLLESTDIQPYQLDSDCRFPPEVYSMPTKDLNQYVKLMNLSAEDVREIKVTRRKLKSRVYARRCRQKQKITKTIQAHIAKAFA